MADKRMSLGDIANMNTLRPDEMEDEEVLQVTAGDGDELDGSEIDVSENNSKTEEYITAVHKKKEPERLVHSTPSYTVIAKPSKEDLFRFLFSHTYLNPMGIVAMLIGVAAIVFVVISAIKSTGTLQTVLLAAVALVFIMNSPVSLYFKAKKQAESMENESDHITYCFSDAGFDMTKADGYVAYDWSQLFLVKEGKTGIYMYLARNQAFVLPDKDLGNDIEAFRKLVSDHVDPKKCKLNK